MPKTILITGAGSGIGKQAALQLAARGHQVIATCHTQSSLDSLKVAAEEQGVSLGLAVLDINDNAAVQKLAKEQTVDVMINNAAIGDTGPIAEVPLERVRHNFETNVLGTLGVIQAFTPQMIARKNGRIIIMSSMVGLTAPMFFNPYAGTKAALESMAMSLRDELKYFNIDTVVINPGRIDGGHNAEIAATKYEWLKPASPYYDLIAEMKRHDRVLLENAYAIAPVVQDIIKAVEATKPRVRYASPFKYRFGLVLIRLLPSRTADWLFFKADRLKFLK